MITIKFAHKYLKFPPKLELRRTYLAKIDIVNLEDLDKIFLDNDTAYSDDENHINYYPLPKKGKYMILYLISIYKIPEGIRSFSPSILKMHRWQTIRRWTPEKEKYYRSHIGEEVKIEINEA
jgi:hypothetical protein